MKRFRLDTGCVIDMQENKVLSDRQATNLLNELHDEKQSVIDWIDNKIEEIKPYNSELCRATLLELKELYK